MGRKLTKYIGRIREVTYVVIIFTPLFYDATELSLQFIFAAIAFFPIFYYVVEWIDYIVPDPKSIQEDMGMLGGASGSSPSQSRPSTGSPASNFGGDNFKF
jgi:hypothetical protein